MRFVSQLKGKEPKENQVLHGKIYLHCVLCSLKHILNLLTWFICALGIVVTFCNYRRPNIYRPG